jgi:hypothetical protein
MKTKTFFLLCILAVLSISAAKAQNGVSKFVTVNEFNGEYQPCTGDYLFGSIVAESWLSSHNWLIKIRDAVVFGYNDPEGTIPSGNVYEYAGTSPGLNNYVS